MSTVKEVFDSLSEVDRRTLIHAHENEIPYYIKVANKKYIGVYADKIKSLKPQTVAGNWSIGDET